MGLPSSQRNRTSRDMRRSHDALKAVQTTSCPKCRAPVIRHRACPFCGTYKNRQVLQLERRAVRKSRRVSNASAA